MSYRTKMNLIILMLQTAFLILYSIVFFNDVSLFISDGTDYRINISIIFAISMMFYISLQMIMNKKDKLDERNKNIEARSSNVTIVSMIIVTFTLVVTLYLLHLENGSIPIYWLWYFMYTFISLNIIAFTISNLIVPLIGNKYES